MSKWTSIWGNAVSVSENKPASYAKDITLRYMVKAPFGGSSLRFTFDNYCGTEAVTITKATVMKGDECQQIFFDTEAHSSATIEAKENVTSLPVEMKVEADDKLFVSFYLGDFTKMRSSVYVQGPLTSGSYAMGDMTEVKDFPIELSRKTNIFYFLSNVSLLTDDNKRTVVCYGDSITAQDWPDYLSLILKEKGINDTAIIRRATSGSRILREYHDITYESYGLMGVNRFNHEVPTDGADTVIIQQGINDIIHPVGTDINPFRPMSDLPTVEELIDGLKWYISEARKLGYKVYVGTLLPIKGWRTYAPFREDMKNAYNDFIRTTDLIDGYIDFDKAVRDSADAAAFATVYDSGDHLHPSAEGYRRMAEEAAKIFE